jgi:ribose transport system substrate-binding protein
MEESMKKKGLVFLTAILVIVVLLTGCSRSSGGKKITMKVGISVMFAHPFFDTITKGVESVMGPKGYTVVAQIGEFNVQKQIADVEDFIAQDFDAIFIEPFDSAGIRPALESAKRAGIPVICLDSSALDIDLVVSNCVTDNYNAGVLNAKKCIEDLGNSGKIVVLNQLNTQSAVLRENGFVETLAKEAPGIQVVATQDYSGQQEIAMSIMENILQAQPEFNAVYAINENGAFGAMAAMEAHGRADGVFIYTVDGSSEAAQMIANGKISGIAAQQPFNIGTSGGQVMLRHMAGESVEKEINVQPLYLTKENVATYQGW